MEEKFRYYSCTKLVLIYSTWALKSYWFTRPTLPGPFSLGLASSLSLPSSFHPDCHTRPWTCLAYHGLGLLRWLGPPPFLLFPQIYLPTSNISHLLDGMNSSSAPEPRPLLLVPTIFIPSITFHHLPYFLSIVCLSTLRPQNVSFVERGFLSPLSYLGISEA